MKMHLKLSRIALLSGNIEGYQISYRLIQNLWTGSCVQLRLSADGQLTTGFQNSRLLFLVPFECVHRFGVSWQKLCIVTCGRAANKTAWKYFVRFVRCLLNVRGVFLCSDKDRLQWPFSTTWTDLLFQNVGFIGLKMADFFTPEDLQQLLAGKHVVFLGDSVMRAIYKVDETNS